MQPNAFRWDLIGVGLGYALVVGGGLLLIHVACRRQERRAVARGVEAARLARVSPRRLAAYANN